MKAFHQGQLDYFCALYAFINALKLTHGLNLSQSREIFSSSVLEISSHPTLLRALFLNQNDGYWLIDYLLSRFCARGPYALRVGRLPDATGKQTAASGLRDIRLQAPEPCALDESTCGKLWAAPPSFGAQPSGDNRPQTVAGAKKQEPHAQTCTVYEPDSLWHLLQDWLPARGFFSSLIPDKSKERTLLLRFHRYLPGCASPIISHWTTGLEFHRDTLLLFDCTASREAIHSLDPAACVIQSGNIGAGKYLGLEPESLYFLEKA